MPDRDAPEQEVRTVSNAYAWEIISAVEQLWQGSPMYPKLEWYADDLRRGPAGPRKRAMELRRKLAASRLAELLPGGLTALPDIYRAYPGWYCHVARLFAPKNYRQLALHVIRELDWYLDRDDRRLRARLDRELTWGALRTLGYFAALYLLAQGLGQWPWLFSFLLLLIVLPLDFMSSRLNPLRQPAAGEEVAEFYLYIRAAYTDAEEPDRPAAL